MTFNDKQTSDDRLEISANAFLSDLNLWFLL